MLYHKDLTKIPNQNQETCTYYLKTKYLRPTIITCHVKFWMYVSLSAYNRTAFLPMEDTAAKKSSLFNHFPMNKTFCCKFYMEFFNMKPFYIHRVYFSIYNDISIKVRFYIPWNIFSILWVSCNNFQLFCFLKYISHAFLFQQNISGQIIYITPENLMYNLKNGYFQYSVQWPSSYFYLMIVKSH